MVTQTLAVRRNLDDLRAVGLGPTEEDVQKQLKAVRKAGFAVAYGEVTPGAVGIAAPVRRAGAAGRRENQAL